MDKEKTNKDTKTKAVFVDLDSTLTPTNDPSFVSEANIKALKELQQRGIYVIIATGRTLRDAISIRDKIRLNEFGDYTISSNGSLVTGKDLEELNSNFLSFKNYKMLIDFGIENKYAIKITSERALFIDNFLFRTIAKFFDKSFSYHKYSKLEIDSLSKTNHDKVGFFFYKKKDAIEAIKNIKDTFHDDFEVVLTANGHYIEVTNNSATKAHGAQILADKLNIDLEESYAFGDSLNDWEIFRLVGKGIAMENSMHPLFEVAFDRTLSIDNDGVAFYINRKILSNE